MPKRSFENDEEQEIHNNKQQRVVSTIVSQFSHVGNKRKCMEDVIISEHFGVESEKLSFSSLLVCVLDGHGGKSCVHFVASCFWTLFRKYMLSQNIQDSLSHALSEIHELWKTEALQHPKPDTSGTTLIAAVIDTEKKIMYVVNIGDSQLVHVRGSEVKWTSKMDDMDSIEQRDQVRKLSTSINTCGTSIHMGRVRRVNGVMAMSGAIGDLNFPPKKFWDSDRKEVCVGSVSECLIRTFTTTVIEVMSGDKVILASDGIFDVVDKVKINSLAESNPDFEARDIANIDKLWLDNIAVIVVQIK